MIFPISTPKKLTLMALAVLLLAGGPLLAGEAASEEGDHHEIVIQKLHAEHDCEGDECPHMQRRIFISEDGTTTELHGDDMKWVHLDGNHDKMFEKRGFLGVQFSELTPELREHFGVPAEAGVLISKVVEGSPAERAGVQVGDILTRVDDSDITSGRQLMKAIGHSEDGATVNLEIWRANRVQTLAATIEAREPQMEKRMMKLHGAGSDESGLHRVIEIRCEDGEDGEGGDCDVQHHGGVHHLELNEYCGDTEECEVKVNCDDDGCSCTVNGTEVDCPEGIGG